MGGYLAWSDEGKNLRLIPWHYVAILNPLGANDLKKMRTDLSKYSPMLDLFSALSIPGVDWCEGERERAYLTPVRPGPLPSCLICRFLCPNCQAASPEARPRLAITSKQIPNTKRGAAQPSPGYHANL